MKRADLWNILNNVSSIAVIGASEKEGKVGNTLIKNIVSYGFQGDIYPVNPKYKEIYGLRAYPSLSSLPKTPDIVVIAVPAQVVPAILREARLKGSKLAVIISSGFKEVGSEEAEKALEEAISEGGLRVVGPNSAGISITKLRLHASIEVIPNKGPVGLAMQSGAMGGVVISRLKELSSGISFFISLGNIADIGVKDTFEYALFDESTMSMIAYIEWIRKGREFIDTGVKLSLKKPICILKGGRGERSLKAIVSHTGGLAGNYEIFKSAVNKIGAYMASDVDDLVEVCEVIRRLGKLYVEKVLIVSNSGGLAIITASQLEDEIELPELSISLREKIAGAAGKKFIGVNPIDFGGDSFIDEIIRPFMLKELKKYFDIGVLVYVPTAAEKPASIIKAVKELSPNFQIPVIAYFDGEGSREIFEKVSHSVPIVSNSRNLAYALKALRRRYAFLKRAGK